MDNQQELWNNIAPDWNESKTRSDPEITEFLKEAKKEQRILDLGCGSGRHFIKTPAHLTGLDFSQNMVTLAEKKAQELDTAFTGVVHDLQTKTLPFEDNVFDFILCTATLHCIEGKETRQAILREIHRILKKNGKAYLKVWNRKSIRFGGKEEKMIGWKEVGKRYYYFYTPEEFKEAVESAGFSIKHFNHHNNHNQEGQEISVIITK